MIDKCPCGSSLPYETCCQPYHRGALASNAEALMRSRYVAYALNLPEYIIQTTHPSSPEYVENQTKWKKEISEFSRHSTFNKLDVLDFKEGEKTATITFTAHIMQNGEDATFSEQSYFEKVRGRWFYRAGQVRSGKAPNLVTNHQMRLLPIAYYGDPILLKTAAPVQKITDGIRTLIEDMDETMIVCDGMGIAAPQVHHSLQIFIMRPPMENEVGEFQLGELKVMINPKIISSSDELTQISEGCLSIPKTYGDVTRPKEITIEYQNIEGKVIRENLTGWPARIAQHEMDHLLGILFIDHLSKEDRELLEPQLERIKRKMHDDGYEM